MVARTGHFGQRIVLFLLLLAPLSGLGSPVYAQGVGFQGGFTIDPEQAFFGSHLETNELGYNVHFRPGIDGAFGNDLMLASINIDFVYKFNIGNAWSVYQGGGPAIYFYKFDHPSFTDVTGGLTGIFGFVHSSGFFTEFRFGNNGPNLKFGAGWTIRY
ncbi:MAG TPA: hypothetical protein VH702_21045 [Vicinamibacterales bacterium]